MKQRYLIVSLDKAWSDEARAAAQAARAANRAGVDPDEAAAAAKQAVRDGASVKDAVKLGTEAAGATGSGHLQMDVKVPEPAEVAPAPTTYAEYMAANPPVASPFSRDQVKAMSPDDLKAFKEKGYNDWRLRETKEWKYANNLHNKNTRGERQAEKAGKEEAVKKFYEGKDAAQLESIRREVNQEMSRVIDKYKGDKSASQVGYAVMASTLERKFGVPKGLGAKVGAQLGLTDMMFSG